MIIVIRKWNLLLLSAILFFTVGGIGLSGRKTQAVPAAAIPGFGKRIIIDAGHGEPDGGAVGRRGVQEKDLNLAIVKLLQGYLEQSGAEVLLTRSDDNGIYDAGSRSIRQKKRSDLHNREKLMNESGADYFISIHMNHFSDGRYSGPQVFYSKHNESAKGLAQRIQEEMIAVLAPEEKRDIKPAGNEIYLLKKAEIPAVLIECGFMSNDKEEQLLLDETYQKKTAWAIYGGILRYLSES